MMPDGGRPGMTSNKSDRIDVIADGLDDLKTTAEELANEVEDGSQTADPKAVNRLKDALEQAIDAADDLEDQT
jgi:hypothetical protein